MKRILKKILNKKEDDFSAVKMFSIAKYGKERVTKNQLYENWEKSVKEKIQYKSSVKENFSCIINIPKDCECFIDMMIEFLREKGFCASVISEETLKNFTGTQKYILVTWENIELCKE